MHFWLPTRIEPQDQPPVNTCDLILIDYYKNKKGVKITPSTLKIEALGLMIRGEYETKKASEVIILMKAGGALRFNWKDSLDEKILTVDQLRAMGYGPLLPSEEKPEVKVADEPIAKPEVVEPEEVKKEPVVLPTRLPDFDVMSKDAIVGWADSQEPPIHLDRRKRKEALMIDLKTALKKRGK